MSRPRIVHPLDVEEAERRSLVATWEERLEAFGVRCDAAPRFTLGPKATATPDLFLPDFGLHLAVESVDGDDDGGATWARDFADAVGPLLVVRGEPVRPYLVGGRAESHSRLFCYTADDTGGGLFELRAFFARMTDDDPAWLAVETGRVSRDLYADAGMRKRLPRVVALDSEAQVRGLLRLWRLEP